MTPDVSAELLQVRQAVDAALAVTPDAAVGLPVVVAVSGGPDSLALAAGAQWACERRGMPLAAVIVDHGLQADSAQVAARARRQCAGLGVERAVVERVVVAGDAGLEAAARQARYAALAAAADALGARIVLLGHTREDQAETVLLRLAQGSGARSLAGMRAVTGRWHRPLLEISRATTQVAARDALAAATNLESADREPWADPHNIDAQFARVRVRALMPELAAALDKDVVAGLARTAGQLADDADALDALADALVAAQVVVDEEEVSADADWLDGLLRALRTRIIRRMCIAAGSPERDLGWEHIVATERLVTDWSGQGATSLPGGVSAVRAYGRLRVKRAQPHASSRRGN